MKILYAVQATGNGHIARAIELMPHLKKYGKVDIFLSGSNSSLPADDRLNVKYRSKGLSLFYGNKGGLSYWNTLRKCSIANALKDAYHLPVDKYDVVLNDFESITSIACRMKNVRSIGFGHQASFQSYNSPRPANKDLLGEFVLKNYARCTNYLGLHFDNYADFIMQPVIKENILTSSPTNGGYITVYLPHYHDEDLILHFSKISELTFVIFSPRAKTFTKRNNVIIRPIDNKAFTLSMINAYGIITGGGFETPAECLYLGKKLMLLPIKGQYEQMCNAEALRAFNVPVIHHMTQDFSLTILKWINAPAPKKLHLYQTTAHVVSQVISKAYQINSIDNNSYPWNEEDMSPTFIY